MPSIVENLWNINVSSDNYGSKEQYFNHILEQYKMAVEMADRVSARRNLTNTFFLTLHTLLITTIGFVYEKGPKTTDSWLNVFLLIPLLSLCYSWWRMIRSYRQLNTAKYEVIGEYESRLPSSPYWCAEWKLLGEGKNKKIFRTLTDIENWVPIIFCFIYIIGFITLLII